MWIKQHLAFLLIVLISIENFAAVVGDYDGTAFVTKEEFETLKTDFSKQLTNYNASLDSKIDGSIANYLNGNTISNKQEIKQMDSYKTIRWMHGPYMYFTNRRFTEFSTADGKYVDTVRWQILKPENRRQTNSDAYAWCYDNIRDNFNNYHVAFMLQPSGGATKHWGIAYGNSEKRYGPTPYIECEKLNGEWVLTDLGEIIRGELGYVNYLWARPHSASITNKFSWSGEPSLKNTIISANTLTNADISQAGDIIGYRVGNLPKADSTKDPAEVSSHISIKHNPNWPATSTTRLTIQDNPLKKACGECGYGLSRSHYIDDGLVEDNKWVTRSQKDKDDANFRYSMFGQDCKIETNVAPKQLYASTGGYLDLSESTSSTTYRAKMQSFNIVNTVPWGTKTDHNSWIYGTGYISNIEFIITVPLFYRIQYGELRNRVHKTLSGEYLKKGGGYPILQEADANGNLRLQIKYEEKKDTDTSVVTLTTDNKIKTYFKNKRFDDIKGEYYQGTKDLDGKGTLISLNGTEWTTGIITINVEVKKGEDVWMRIDPLTENGVYCLMTDINAVFVPEK